MPRAQRLLNAGMHTDSYEALGGLRDRGAARPAQHLQDIRDRRLLGVARVGLALRLGISASLGWGAPTL